MLLTLENAKVGMCVLLTHPDPGYTIGDSNPKVGTEYECLGRVVSAGSGSIQVRWNNGTNNTYKANELSLYNTGIFVDLWEEM